MSISEAQALEERGDRLRLEGKLAEAESVLKRCLSIREARLGRDGCAGIVNTLHSLGRCLLHHPDRLDEAESMFRRCLEIQEAELGFDNLDVAETLYALGTCLAEAGKLEPAQDAQMRCLAIKEDKLGPEDVRIASNLYELGVCFLKAQNLEKAEEMFERCLIIQEANLGRGDVNVADTLHSLGVCLMQADKLKEAEVALRRCLAIWETKLGRTNVRIAYVVSNLGFCLLQIGCPDEAEGFMRRGFAINGIGSGQQDVQIADTMHHVGRALRQKGELPQARKLLKRCVAIRETQLGRENDTVVGTRFELAVCLRQGGWTAEAEGELRRCLAIQEASLGRGDVKVASTLSELGECLKQAGEVEETEKVLRRCLAIWETKLGPEDLQVAWPLHALGVHLRETKKVEEAEKCLRRCLAICEPKLGHESEGTIGTLIELGRCLRDARELEVSEKYITGKLSERKPSSRTSALPSARPLKQNQTASQLRPSSTLHGLAAIASAAKWVAVKDGQLHTTGEAREILMEVREDEPLNLLTVFGAAKCGKSFLMNALTGFDNMFPVSPGVTPCTAGADLSPILMPLSSFRRGGGRTDNSPVVSASPEPTIVFSDMEGQGDQSAEHDTRLAIPFLLLSQVVIFNWKGLPNKNTILQRLAVMTNAAEKVKRHEDEGATTFGHLVLLIRDISGKAGDIEVQLLRDEESATERNKIRRGLKKAFKSITVHSLPRPHEEIDGGAVPLAALKPEFTTSLDELRSIIATHLSTPYAFGGAPIAGGERLHDIVGALCDAVNSTGDICPPSVLQAIETKRVQDELRRALVLFDAILEKTNGDMGRSVLSTYETECAILRASESALKQFDDATQTKQRLGGGPPGVHAKEAREGLLVQISSKARALAGTQEARRRKLNDKIQALVSASESAVAREALRWNTVNGPAACSCMTKRSLEEQWERLVGSHFRVLKGDVHKIVANDGVVDDVLLTELGWVLSKGMFEGLVKGTLDQVQDLNRMAIAREKDGKAGEYANRRAARLAGENARLRRQTAARR